MLAQLADESIRHGWMDVAAGLISAGSHLGPVLHDLGHHVQEPRISPPEASHHFKDDD